MQCSHTIFLIVLFCAVIQCDAYEKKISYSEYLSQNSNAKATEQQTNISREHSKWIVVTKTLTKKVRKMNFQNYVLEQRNIAGEFNLKRGWKLKLTEALNRGNKVVLSSQSKLTLKSSRDSLTILSGTATLNQGEVARNRRTNITCRFTEKYDCITPVIEKVFIPCWNAPGIQCIRYQIRYVNAVCQRTVRRCCAGYVVGASTYCELITRARPPRVTSSSCGGQLTAAEGVLTSPRYPNQYDNELNCTWTIRGRSGFKIVMRITDLELEEPVGGCALPEWHCFNFCDFDILEIYDATAKHTRKMCGKRAPTSHLISAGNTIVVTFSTDVSLGGKGFKIVYAIVPEIQLSPVNRQCVGGQTWQTCHRKCADSCTKRPNASRLPCFDSQSAVTQVKPEISSTRFDEITCIPGCACPVHKPFWHNGRCTKAERCPGDLFSCGKPVLKAKLKIVGGKSARRAAWPWMAQLESDLFSHICGATLICSNWVITAAHCFLNVDGDALDLDTQGYIISVGKYWKHGKKDESLIQIFEPQGIIVHPRYRVNTDTDIDVDDIALIRLPRAVQVTDYVRPACLPEPTTSLAGHEQPTDGTVCKVLGWGSTEGVGPNANQLKEASISIRKARYCDYDSYDWRLMICAGGHKSTDTCKGDSGGPLLCQRDGGKWFLDGITSFGDFCGKKDVAGGYVRVSSYINWIKRHVGYQCEK